jgi:hypothetical protein
VLEFLLPSGTVNVVGVTTNPGAAWRGQPDVLSRLLFGVDRTRVDPSAWPAAQRAALDALPYLIQWPIFALQDAVDFATFAVRTTIDVQRFTDGTAGSPGGDPTCGGPIEVATIVWPGDISWVQQTRLVAPTAPGRAEGALG